MVEIHLTKLFLLLIGIFDLIVDEDKPSCPICKGFVKAITCGLTGYKYTYTGIKKSTTKSRP